MYWSTAQKRAAAIAAPLTRAMLRADSRVIERTGWYQVVTPSSPGTLRNEVVHSQVEPGEADAVIDEVIATYAADRHPVKWCVGPWTRPEDFGDALTRRGFSSWDVRAMAASTSLALDRAGDVEVVEVSGRELEPFVSATLRGWSLPDDQLAAELEVHRAALEEVPRVAHFFAARIAGEIVGTAALFDRGDHAYLVGTQVFESFRGRGIYGALVAARLGFLARRGITLAVTHAREATSAPALERLGFETLFRYRCYLLEAA